MSKLRPTPQNTFCSFPWTGVQLHVSGQIRPCCMMDDLGIQFKSGVQVKEQLETDRMMQIRSELLANQRPRECHACFEEEDLGISSLRMASPEIEVKEGRAAASSIERAEISFTNVCNMSCAMCYPEFSTRVANFHREFHEQRGSLRSFRQPQKFTVNESDVESLVEQFRHAQEVRIIGGEPFTSPAARRFVRMWADQEFPGLLDIATNSSLLDDEILEDLQRCKRVLLCMSIDGHGKLYEWIRGHAWEPVEKILLKANSKVRMKLSPTLQAYNIAQIDTLSSFCKTNGLRLRMGHVLRTPHHLSLLLWPYALRQQFAKVIDRGWGEDKGDVLNVLNRTERLSPDLYQLFFEWTEFLNHKRGFRWQDCEPQSNHLMRALEASHDALSPQS